MKKSELESMISEIVRKECKTALYEALTELFAKPQTQSQPQPRQVVRPTVNNSQPIPIKEQKVFTSNPILNSILNETANDPNTRSRISAMNTGTPTVSGEGVDISSLPGMQEFKPSVVSQEEISYGQLDEGVNFSIGNLPPMSSMGAPVPKGMSKMAEIVKRSLEKDKAKYR